MNKQHGFSTITIIALAVIAILGLAGAYAAQHFKKDAPSFPVSAPVFNNNAPTKNTNQATPENAQPQFIQSDFIDLTNVYAISKFRSGSGHDFSQSSGENCRSMKHYFNARRTNEIEQLINQNRGMAPAPDGKTDTSIYSPINGKIIAIEADQMPIGEQIYIRPSAYPQFTIRLFHVYPMAEIKTGAEVRAGQKIGVIGRYQNTDIAVVKGWSNYVSYFEVMPDKLFSKYQKLGIKNRDELIISKAERDANPLQCNGEWFAQNYENDPDTFVYLKNGLK